jgi:D-xylose transport system substrate-binding protein
MRRRKFSLTVNVAVLVLFALAFLPYNGPTEAEAQTMKIGFILKTMQEERYQTDKAAFMVKAEELGVEVLFDSSSNNELVQLQQVEKMLDEGIQVLVLQPVNTGTAGNLVRLLTKKE